MTQILNRTLLKNTLLLLSFILLSACGTSLTNQDGNEYDVNVPEVNEASIQSNILLIKQQYQAANDFYQQALTESDSTEQKIFIQLRLAASFADLEQVHQSRKILESIVVATLSPAQQQLLILAKANIAICGGCF